MNIIKYCYSNKCFHLHVTAYTTHKTISFDEPHCVRTSSFLCSVFALSNCWVFLISLLQESSVRHSTNRVITLVTALISRINFAKTRRMPRFSVKTDSRSFGYSYSFRHFAYDNFSIWTFQSLDYVDFFISQGREREKGMVFLRFWTTIQKTVLSDAVNLSTPNYQMPFETSRNLP